MNKKIGFVLLGLSLATTGFAETHLYPLREGRDRNVYSDQAYVFGGSVRAVRSGGRVNIVLQRTGYDQVLRADGRRYPVPTSVNREHRSHPVYSGSYTLLDDETALTLVSSSGQAPSEPIIVHR